MVEESFDQPWVEDRVRLLEQGIFRAGKCWGLRNTSGLSGEDNGIHEGSLLNSTRTMTCSQSLRSRTREPCVRSWFS